VSVINSFLAKNVKYSHAELTAYVVDEHDRKLTFKFTVLCKRQLQSYPNAIFFNTDSHQCLLVADVSGLSNSQPKYQCWVLRFWLNNDLPILSARIFDNQDKVMADIAEQFGQQYASLILDGIINQD
jgi:hypothetical protein